MALRNMLAVLSICMTLSYAAMAGRGLQIGPVQSSTRPALPELHQKDLVLYDNVTQECNFFADQEYIVAPWPVGCQVYQHTNGCNKYEISQSGKGVNSCQLKYNCPFQLVEAKCLEYYPTPEGDTRFPDTGKQCFFKESLYPLVPWPQSCKIFQAGDVCNTYEISDEGNYITSCDITMKAGVCIAPNTKTFECLEFCSDGTCIKVFAAKLTLAVVSSIAVIAAAMI